MKRLIFGTRSYHWFEKVVVAVLTLMVGISVILTLVAAGVELWKVVVSGDHLLDHQGFLKVFAAFMTVLIALEFNHTVLPDITSKTPLVKVQAVLLVALLALARKVVLVDFKTVSYALMIGLGVLILAVAGAYWVLRREDGECS
ncbi:phosphate-starvation-inducible PsiE family protein [Geothermobacter hydrogeniphilus]|nr:phosphate-starvation-inducible PsiE family protein [Geothermobacter hydrogeniphilus]